MRTRASEGEVTLEFLGSNEYSPTKPDRLESPPSDFEADEGGAHPQGSGHLLQAVGPSRNFTNALVLHHQPPAALAAYSVTWKYQGLRQFRYCHYNEAVGVRGPKAPLDGEGLQIAEDFVALLNSKDAGGHDCTDYRGLARRYLERVSPLVAKSWRDGQPIPPSAREGLGRLRNFLHKEVAPRVVAADQREWILSDGLAARLSGYLLHRKLGTMNRPQAIGMRSPFTITYQPPRPPSEGEENVAKDSAREHRNPLWSPLPILAVNALILEARYWPFGYCMLSGCGRFFVPKSARQLYCSRACQARASYLQARSMPGFKEAAVQRAKLHRRRKADGKPPQRRPGAGRPRKSRASEDQPGTGRKSPTGASDRPRKMNPERRTTRERKA